MVSSPLIKRKKDRPNVTASILIVDDDRSIRAVMEATLSRLGYRTRSAGDGRDALALMQARPADLVITDLAMPEMDGTDLIVALRGFAGAPRVIAISGDGVLGEATAQRLAERLGADLVLQKPLSMSALAKAVAAQLDRRDAERRPSGCRADAA